MPTSWTDEKLDALNERVKKNEAEISRLVKQTTISRLVKQTTEAVMRFNTEIDALKKLAK